MKRGWDMLSIEELQHVKNKCLKLEKMLVLSKTKAENFIESTTL